MDVAIIVMNETKFEFLDVTLIHRAEMGFLGAVYGWNFIDKNRSEHTA